jgi:FixJ family two-component response regulator
MSPKKAPLLICIVADDDSARQRIDSLIRSTGSQTSVFDSSQAFLRSYHSQKISCLVLDACLSGVSGLQLLRMLADANIFIPIVFVTSRVDVGSAQALAHGAVKVLRKPFTNEELLSAITALVSPQRSV